MIAIERVTRAELMVLISGEFTRKLTEEQRHGFVNCLEKTTILWVGHVEGKFICAWGLIPPTLISDIAYIWLHVVEDVGDHEFSFVRKSQIAVKELLKQYPRITGHCEVGAERSIRWLKWLGAKFGEPDGRMVPFLIKAA